MKRLLFFSLSIAVLVARVRSDDNNQSKTAPNYWGCQNTVSRALPYCNSSLSIDDRVQNLVSLLTLDEKIAAIAPNYLEYADTCTTHTAGVPRVGFPDYMWLVETNTAVASACIAQDKCATEFAGPLTMGASFNRTSWHLKGSVFGTEQRAFANLRWTRGRPNKTDYIGLTAYGPNINQQRDPRFGRTSELPGEDPYLSGQYAKHMVQGMQEQDSLGHPKVLAYLKHFTGYNREMGRGHDDYNITLHDLFDTYLPQFEMGLREGKATGVMCSYNAINGKPMCANDYLLNQVMRKKWNVPLAHVTTDCGAPGMLRGRPANAPDNATAAAWALMNGSDVEMGSTVWSTNLKEAVDRKLATEEAVNQAFARSYRTHFVAGRFDDYRHSEWSQFGLDDINSKYHQQIQLEAALQGLVLLKNENDVLPIKPGSKVAVLGPLGQTTAGLMSDYECDQSCYGGGHDCIPTLAESIAAVNGASDTMSASGVDIDSNKTSDISNALELASDAQVIVLCLGITKGQEREGVDRTDTRLPGLQQDFAHQALQLGKPVILVLVNGGQVALDDLVDGPSSIVEAFNPNTIGGTALALSLFGVENRWGKLPYTIYPYHVMQSFDMKDHSMSTPPGRTHRYFSGEPVFSFGYGLSLTSFELSCYPTNPPKLSFQCLIWNTGTMVGDEVVQVYHSAGDDVRSVANHPVPLQSLVDFDRVRMDPGDVHVLNFEFDTNVFSLVNEHGDKVVYAGTHKLKFTNGVSATMEFERVVTREGKGNLRATAIN